MSKHTPPRDPESAYFENLGRMNAAAGIQWLMPRLNSWLGDQLQSMLHGLGLPQGDLAKPVRNSASLAATEASLGLLIGEPRVKRPYTRRGTGPVAQGARVRALPTSEMIDGRYTKMGAAKFLGMSKASVDRRVKGLTVVRLMNPAITTGKRTPLATYDAAEIEALAAQHNGAGVPVEVESESGYPAPEMIDGRYTLKGAAQVLEIAKDYAGTMLRKRKVRHLDARTKRGQLAKTYAADDIHRIAEERKGVRK